MRRAGLIGIALGGLAVLACELPLILAAIGLGGLSAIATKLQPPLAVEIAAIGFLVLGVAVLVIVTARRLMRMRRLGDQ